MYQKKKLQINMFFILLAIVFKLIKTVTQKDRDFDGNM